MAPSFSTLAARRFGYGLRPGETPPADVESLMTQVSRGTAAKPRFPREGLLGRKETIGRLVSVRTVEAKVAEAGRPNASMRADTEREADRLFFRDALGRIAQAVYSENGFYERLASFWLDHFSIDAAKTYEMRMIAPVYEAEAIRPHLAGPFSDLLRAAVLHPAMLISTDQTLSVAPQSPAGAEAGGALNDRLARALLQDYALGPDVPVAEADIQAAAMLLTGVTVDVRTLTVGYEPQRAEPGRLTLLGRTYGEGGRGAKDHLDLLGELADRPETAQFVCRSLVRHFIAEVPPQEVVEAMVSAWTATGGNLTAVYRAMLDQPRAWAPEAGTVIQPFDFVVSSLRALDVKGETFEAMAKAADDAAATERAAGDAKAPVRYRAEVTRALTVDGLERMGQPIWGVSRPLDAAPPSAAAGAANTRGVDAGGPAQAEGSVQSVWLTKRQLAERIAWIRLAARVLIADPHPAALIDTALADAARDETRTVVPQAPTKLHGLTMVFLSPEFNRR
ncbi:DUF1800 family protein [Rhizobium sp. 0TCS1.26]|uniref:DUF1800 family protein n=1 Tax=Rhizobium sp. 0TCS1.26 TaxID=3142623 RepID=UPI003D2D00AF